MEQNNNQMINQVNQQKELIPKFEFRHAFVVMLLVSFMILIGVPFWVGSKALDTHAWTYLSTGIGVVATLLTLAGKRLFDDKTEPLKNEEQPQEINGTVHGDISGANTTNPNTCNCGKMYP